MIDFLVGKLHDIRFITMLLAAISVSVTAYTLIMPLFVGENLNKRMKAVASERERIRQRERERLNRSEKVSLRQTPKQIVSKVVEDFNLTKWLAQESALEKLVMPLWPAYDSWLDSKTADITNAPSGGFAGSITCALFLQRFVEAARSWLHVDIFGWTPSAKPGRPEGGECQAARAIYKLLSERYG